MSRWIKTPGGTAIPHIAIVVMLLFMICVTLYMKNQPDSGTVDVVDAVDAVDAVEEEKSTDAPAPAPAKKLPRLVDLGADKCIPCKAMAPILEAMKKEYAGVLDVEFIDVWKNPGAGKTYGVKLIPTQIFFDAEGKERFRHEGFFSREDILKKWKELGVSLDKKP